MWVCWESSCSSLLESVKRMEATAKGFLSTRALLMSGLPQVRRHGKGTKVRRGAAGVGWEGAETHRQKAQRVVHLTWSSMTRHGGLRQHATVRS